MTGPVEVLLGPGAAGTQASMAPYVEGLVRRGVVARVVGLRKGTSPVPRAEVAVPRFLAGVQDPSRTVAGGRSYGARVASLAAVSAPVPGFAGLLLFSYPLHRPGHPELGSRVAHWPQIACPLLLLSGGRDPFASAELLREASRLVPGARLVLYPGTGHQLGEYLEDALEEAAAFVRGLASGL